MTKMKSRVSRIGSYAIASSKRDGHHQQPCITCTTFNILAPIYKRLNHDSVLAGQESKDIGLLLAERSSIICLQEFWVGNEELVKIYEKRLGDAGYVNFQLARTNNRGDGLLTAVHKDYFRVVNYQEILFNDCGYPHCEHPLVISSRLQFVYSSIAQVYRILQYVESYQKENKLNPMPIILCGDWNGSKRGHVYKFLRSQGFVSSYDTAHHYTDADAHKWVSHRNHRGNICGVDFIWLLNPNSYRKLLKTSWSEAVFGMFKYLLRKASLTEDDAFAFLKADNPGDYITYSGFCEALRQLNMTGHCHGLSLEETKDLWVQADIDGNGILDYAEFQQRIWNPTGSEQRDESGNDSDSGSKGNQEQTIGFSVKNAVLFPPEVEKGTWPEDYSLSDHARLTVVFSPIRMPCSQMIL
ncbi:unnamed protein product [Prunus armeniaca]|uniref:Endonuclease/exonuclease/phosphatase domain-containing protein n=1 Tax=Prunus armeniaca TaxID=36596 RepID=A0A6J5UBQ8_PRUAR|nr:unnamed protein product [Prunus armeniaca]